MSLHSRTVSCLKALTPELVNRLESLMFCRRKMVRAAAADSEERAVFPARVLLLPDGLQPVAALGLDLQAVATPSAQP